MFLFILNSINRRLITVTKKKKVYTQSCKQFVNRPGETEAFLQSPLLLIK